MTDTVNLHDLMQYVGMGMTVLGIVWWFQRDRRTRNADIIKQVEEKTHMKRDIEECQKRLVRHEGRDDRIFAKLEELSGGQADIRDRITKLEGTVDALAVKAS